MRRALLVAAWLAMGTAATAEEVSKPRTISFEDRVACQRRIEEVLWAHTIWPEQNPGQKPPLSEVLSDASIRSKVEDHLLMSRALDVYWHRAVTPDQLQAELERMAAGTRQPGVLRDLLSALGGDPAAAAECLARPALVDRLVRSWYARDGRFHAATRAEASEALAAHPAAVRMKSLAGDYAEADLLRSEVDAETWGRIVGDLAGRLGVSIDPGDPPEALLDRLPKERISDLVEQDDGFIAQAVLGKGDGRLRVATVRWPKRSFDDWWGETRRDLGAVDRIAEEMAPIDPAFAPSLPVVPLSGCSADTWAPTHGETPDGRSYHTAVWTGTEMIVWGGYISYNSAYLNTGGRYRPATDTWTPTSLGDNVPAARRNHTAVWTGKEMIVWGGNIPLSTFNTGGRYNPATDTWSRTSTTGAVAAKRYNHTAVWTGHQMIVWGGYDALTMNTGGRYDPVADYWLPTTTTSAPAARYLHTAVWTGTEMIVWGGSTPALNTGGRYNPATNTWLPTSTGSNVPYGRYNHTAVWTGTEMIVWGGYGTSRYNSGGRYSPATDTWLPVSTGTGVPDARDQHTAVWTGTEMIVWGGSTLLSTNTGGRYTPGTDSWIATSIGANVPSARYNHKAVWTGAEMIVWGGGTGDINTGGRYRPADDTWVPTSTGATVPSARYGHSGLWTGAEMIVWGGYTSDPRAYFSSGGRYRPATDTWIPTSTTNAPTARYRQSAVWTGTQMIVWGGYSEYASPQVMNTGGRYDLLTDVWTPTSVGTNVPEKRYYHSAVWSGTEMIVWGGGNPSYLNTGGRYDPAADAWRATSTGANVPEGRQYHAATWTGAEMVVWSGSSSSYLSTGGRYYPSSDSWLPTSTGTNSPTGRPNASVIWTGTEMIVWGGGIYGTGGRYTPSTDTWLPVSTGTGAPAARTDHTAVWTGTEMIVWGGNHTNTGARYNPATNTWIPTTIGANVPTPRSLHVAAWIGSGDERMIVWGGEPKTATGGLYCGTACTPSTWYQDVDGDGYGLSFATTSACTRPPGYVTLVGDCEDGDATRFPGNTEVCDYKDNDCNSLIDDAVIPAGVPNVTLDQWYGVTQIFWRAVPGADGYDAARGNLGTLKATRGDFTAATNACLNNLTYLYTADPTTPPVGDGYWYVIRPYNCKGNGTYDTGSPRQQGSRDAEINASPFACP